MDVIVERPAALDVHKEQVTACVRLPAQDGTRAEEVREFKTTVAGLLVLHDWLKAHGVTQVAMEATGVYWKPVWAILEDDFDCLLVNARRSAELQQVIREWLGGFNFPRRVRVAVDIDPYSFV